MYCVYIASQGCQYFGALWVTDFMVFLLKNKETP